MNEPPSILGWKFHTEFLPRLLRARLRPANTEGAGTSFTSHMELTVMLFACLLALALGTGMAGGRYSLAGWTFGVLGAAGILFVFVSSIVAQRGTRSTFDGFLVWIFFFFVFLGLTSGLCWCSVNRPSRAVGIGAGALGLVAGYMAGIVAGRYAQKLGWISALLNGLAVPAILGILIADALLLIG